MTEGRQSARKSSNVVWHQSTVSRADRERLNGHRGAILWFTGLSGAGKSTIANAVEQRLHELGCRTYLCDGDNIRHGLNSNLGFSPEDRVENIRRIGEVAKLFLDAGVVAMTAFISPYRADRDRARQLAPADFIEVYCRCALPVCEQRDTKGLYRKARAGEVKEFTGISAPYEEPPSPELTLDTDRHGVEECVEQVVRYLAARNITKAIEPA